MRAFLAGPWRAALVLEDDVLLHDTLPAVLRGLLARPGRWDMVKLSAVHRGTPAAVADLAPQASGHRLAVMLSRVTGSSAYLINRAAAQAYLRGPGPGGGGLLPMQLPYDHVFDQGWRFGLKVRLVTPTPCTHDDRIASTIDGSPGASPAASAAAAPPRKFHWTRRLPAFAYRLGNEARRLRYALAQLWRERFGATG
jgi:glycosyl transferase family 25